MIAATCVRLAMMLGILTLLAGCMSESVYLRHPQTGKKAQCGPYMNAGIAASQSATIRERGCIEDYQRQGYERVME